jgi:radical SAM protein with 4Fe4S-binding SPASM domain
MSLELFEKINQELKPLTHELAYHIVGDPLVLSNLNAYLDISLKHKLKVNLTTTGNTISQKDFDNLTHRAVKQVNFSINSYQANSHKKSLDEYLTPLFEFVKFAIEHQKEVFINFRIWNLDETKSAKAFNQAVFEKANAFFNVQLDVDAMYALKPKNIKIARKVFFNFDDYFVWPTLQSDYFEENGFCHGLSSLFGILSSGVVVPCCLDKDGVINLGNVHKESLKTILNSSKVHAIQQGFLNHKATQELCQKCEYKTKFNEKLNVKDTQ